MKKDAYLLDSPIYHQNIETTLYWRKGPTIHDLLRLYSVKQHDHRLATHSFYQIRVSKGEIKDEKSKYQPRNQSR